MSNGSGTSSQSISLPKGGGAIQGIGETFQPNLFSGTGNFSVPIYTSPGRNGFGPQLTLQYSSGNGNGPFGVGWQLSIPRIMRKTEKGLPTYTDEDVFVMSGTEDLVPCLEVDDNPDQWEPYEVLTYCPRTEGQFTRIERWQWLGPSTEDRDTGDIHWRAITKENVTSVYGRTKAARLVDSEKASHIYEWLLEETFDAKGNHIAYEYIQEDLKGIHEHNRCCTQTYLRRIRYGNTPDMLDQSLRMGPTGLWTDPANPLQTRPQHYLFEVLFDYGDLPNPLKIADDLNNDLVTNWAARPDPFSTYRAGFEIRTLRRCQRVLMLHHFKEGEVEGAPVVKSTDFTYTVNPETQLSFLTDATVSGYRRDPNDPASYLKREMPPVTFTYSAFKPQEQRYQSVTAEGRDFPPRSLNNPEFTLMDLFGNGLPDIVQGSPNGFYYWANLGEGHLDRRRPQSGGQPALSLAQANVAVGDMGGDGMVDLVVDAPSLAGFYESTPDGRWKPFRRFEERPSFDLNDPNTRLVDLTGDGLSDVLVTRDHHFLWFRCQGEAGYKAPKKISRQYDLDAFPDVYFNDPAGRVRLADMSGDGLNDIVLVHDGRIDYWPNLGYGHFGRRITMAYTERIGYGYDPRRMFLVDLDGTGCADLVYVDFDQVRFWFNQSGNGWSSCQTIQGTPPVSDLTSVQFTDFYGTGTATLMWNYDFGQQPGGSNYKILDFCGGQKPNLLVEMSNNMGATTKVQYAPSTKFYLEDRANGMPWTTSLPFPVQVVEKTEVIDHISKTKLVTTYKYHHGYYDGREREFRGFGRVDQCDTEVFKAFTESGLHGEEAQFENHQQGFHVPPVETRTWFHTGIYFDEDRDSDYQSLTEQYRSEYYSGDPDALELGEHQFKQPDGSEGKGESPHEAFRALRGAVLRTEVYGRDDSDKDNHPYAVTENRYRVKALQPKDGNNHAVFLTTPLESLSYHYERNPADPRISHSLTLEVDDYGNVTDSVAITYPRRVVPANLPEQGETKIVYTHIDFINLYCTLTATMPTFYYAGIPYQTRAYEVTGIDCQPGQKLEAEDFAAIQDASIKSECLRMVQDASISVDLDSFQPYEWQREESDSTVQRRIIEWTRSYFRSELDLENIDEIGTLNHRLPLGKIESLALPYESYQAVFTNALLEQIYDGRTAGIDLAVEGGYHPHASHPMAEGSGGIENYWWIPSGRQDFNPAKFYQSERAQDPFGNITTTASDAYALLLETAQDALPAPQANVITAKNNYRVLQPYEVSDPNGNRSQVAFDALGLVVGTAVMGTDAAGNLVGDSLEGFVADLPETLRDQHIDDPLNLNPAQDTDPHNILQKATTRLVYDLNRFWETSQPDIEMGQPNVVYTLARETHVSDEAGIPSKIQHAFTYSDGFGRESQTKVQAEPDPDNSTQPRWVGTGTTVYNNKGKAVQQFEPFFSDDHRYGIEQHGVSPTLFYDPSERVVCTVHPNHTYEKVVFDAWQQTTWDSNDTLLLDPRTDPDVSQYVENYFLNYDQDYANQQGEPPQIWYQEYLSSPDNAKRRAAQKTEPHANTPTVTHLDTLGRAVLTIADNGVNTSGVAQRYATRIKLDIESNQREVIDAKNRVVMRYDYDMAGPEEDEEGNTAQTPLHQSSVDAGDRWTLTNVAGNPLRSWDSRGHEIRNTYDELQRPLELFVKQGASSEVLAERTVYGETRPDAPALNLKGQLYQQYDGAGIVTTEAYDFKDNPLTSNRQLRTLENSKNQVNWLLTPNLETQIFTNSIRYDALNRPITLTQPDGSVIRPSYNEANLLNQMAANLRAAPAVTEFVNNIDYNAKGQRKTICYGNGVYTCYDYDPLTFRLVQLKTTRLTDLVILQDLNYTYDPVGNITSIRDDAQQTIFFDNTVVSPNTEYEYDPLYRLIQADGREHAGQGANGQRDHTDIPRMPLPHPNNGQAMRNYTERYDYDEVGNIEKMIHQATNGNWTRHYAYASESNRLLTTSLPGDDPLGSYSAKYEYDAHGNMVVMPHLKEIQWNFKDQMQQVDLGGGGKAYYMYDASGERIRKVHQHSGAMVEERIYLGDYEIYRKSNGSRLTLERETLHIMDDHTRLVLVETKTLDEGTAIPSPTFLIRYQLANHLGSACLELNEISNVISYEEYHPFGTASFFAARSGVEVSLKRYRYTGKERDEESGLYYHGARYMAPWLGRWTSTDPLYWQTKNSYSSKATYFLSSKTSDKTNLDEQTHLAFNRIETTEQDLYLFVDNNPLRFIDPTGFRGVATGHSAIRPPVHRSEQGTVPSNSPIPPKPPLQVPRDFPQSMEDYLLYGSLKEKAMARRILAMQERLRVITMVGIQLDVLRRKRSRQDDVFNVQIDTSTLASMYQRGNLAAFKIVRDIVEKGGNVWISPQVRREFLGGRNAPSPVEVQRREIFLRYLGVQYLDPGIEGTHRFQVGVSILTNRLEKRGDVFVGAAAFALDHPLIVSERRAFERPDVQKLIDIVYVPEPVRN